MGAPSAFHLIELGPGRGTLMADALRAAKLAPEFGAALQLHLVEASPVLIEQQRQRLAQSSLVPEGAIHWHASLETIPLGPSILLANEFFDALPVRQYVKTTSGWHERVIGLDNTQALSFGLAPEAETNINAQAPIGSVLEINTLAYRLIMQIAHRLQQAGGAALIIDYGHVETSFGETLQAMKQHAFVDPLEAPGEADITTHVDFERLGHIARAQGLEVSGPTTQARFLNGLGIVERAARLLKNADAAQTKEVEAALVRLTEQTPTGMGSLFKVLGLRHVDMPEPAGFK
jgi:SAM-dependent MidA family methyltransferase